MAYFVPYVGLLPVATFHMGLSSLQTLASTGLMSYGAVLIFQDARKKRRARKASALAPAPTAE